MKVSLEVLASTSIKRKKPWQRISWIGEEQDSLLLLDAPGHRISVLYVPSGRTKRKLPKVSPLVENVLQFTCTRNGRYLLGVLRSGDIFVWHKERDELKYVHGLDKYKQNIQPDALQIAASGDCCQIFVAHGNSEFYVWVQQRVGSVQGQRDGILRGSWHKVSVPQGMQLPQPGAPECSLAIVFPEHQDIGRCCQCSIIFNRTDMLSIATLVLKFPDPHEQFGKSVPFYSAEWSLLEYPFQQINPQYENIAFPGAYVSCYAPSGQVLAVAANQKSPSLSSMLFVSPLTDTVLVAALKGCGLVDQHKTGRHFWVNDMAWTSDSLFVVCILRNGSVCLVPRLGEPVPIHTHGCSVDLGPAYFLSLHPAMFISDQDNFVEVSGGRGNPMQQQFSVSTHPALPIVLFSDGFLVTVVQLPAETTSVTLMGDLVRDSAKFLKKLCEQERLDMSVAGLAKPFTGKKGKENRTQRQGGKKGYEFELAEISLNSTHESEVSIIDTTGKFDVANFGAVGNMDAGKIVFGEPEIINLDLNATFSGLDASDALLKYLEESMSALTSTWKLAVSFPDIWTSEADGITKQAVHNLSKLFSVVLDCSAVDAIIPALTPRQNSAIQNPRLFNVIVVFRNLLQLLRFDQVSQHLVPAVLGLTHRTLTVILTSKQLQASDPRLKTLFGCYSLLKHAEVSLNKVYGQTPANTETSSAAGTSQAPLGNRLISTWKLLYHQVVQYQSQATDPQEHAHLDKLVLSIQQELKDADLTPRQGHAKLSMGDRLSVGGDHTRAVEAWRDQLKMIQGGKKDSPKTARMLHSVLYTLLLKDQLREAVEFVDSLILQARLDGGISTQELTSQESRTRPPFMTLLSHESEDSSQEDVVPCIKNKSIRHTVQTMARFIAAYFTNSTMYIYPPHNPVPLPDIHMGSIPTKSRIIPKYQENITREITHQNMASLWTTERVVEYFMLCGLVCETAWFAYKMGDWKTAFLLATAHCTHRSIAPHLYTESRKRLQLPDNLTPQSIMQDKLLELFCLNTPDDSHAGPHRQGKKSLLTINDETNLGQLTRGLQDLLTTGIVCEVELAPWLLACLTQRLQAAVSQLPALVPQDFYLPAPPLYCPQPADTEEARDQAEEERRTRGEISGLIHMVLVCLGASNLALPAASWYIQQLVTVQERAAQFKATTEGPCLELPEILQMYKAMRCDIAEFQHDYRTGQVLQSFRDFVSLLWMLHVRDELSLHLRRRGSKLSNDNIRNRDSTDSSLGQDYLQECFQVLKQAVNLLAFTPYLGQETSIRKVVLSLIQELPANEDTADILAEHFYAAQTYDSEVQEKLEQLLNKWQSVDIIPEDDGKSARLEESEDPRQSLDNNDDEDDGSVRKSVTFYQASPRAKTLSVYFHKQCEVVQKVLKKKKKFYGQYEEFVFYKEGLSASSTLGSKTNVSVGSWPFETRNSFFEFLDRFYAISFTKAMQKESEGSRSPVYAILMPFAKLIREAEFQAFISKDEEVSRRKLASVVLASPRTKMQTSQGPATPDSRASSGRRQKRNFGKSMERQPSAGASGMYSPSVGKVPLSPSKSKTNMTELASRFFQSEEVLYRDQMDSQEAQWIMDVNFGHQYLALEQLLDYLQQWVGRQLLLGDPQGVGPTMRIEAPTQLVVLSLWLLEHKYSRVKPPSHRDTAGKVEEREGQEKLARIQQDVITEHLATLEELTEHDSLTQVSNIPRSKAPSQHSQRSRSHSPARDLVHQSFELRGSRDRSLRGYKSFTSTQEETEQVKSAYKKVLDDRDDSSLELSSLEPDDIAEDIKRSSRPQSLERVNRGRSPTQGSAAPIRGQSASPEHQTRASVSRLEGSPERGRTHPPQAQTSTPVRMTRKGSQGADDLHPDVSRISVVPNEEVPGQTRQEVPTHYTGGLLGGNPMPGAHSTVQDVLAGNQMSGVDLASQLQQIVRGELRNMMEVQHRSLMAMMGALDGQVPPLTGSAPPKAPQAPPQSATQSDDQRRKGRPMYKNVLKELRSLEIEERSNRQPRRSMHNGNVGLDAAEEKLRMSLRRDQEQADIYHVSQENVDPSQFSFYPRFLRIPAEKDEQLKFPSIPVQSVPQQESFFKPSPIGDMPLLHVERTVPAHKTGPGQRMKYFQNLPQQFVPAGEQPPPPSHPDSPDSGLGMPLLRLQPDNKPGRRQPQFGELLPPDVIHMDDEGEKAERLRDKYMEEFYEQQLKKNEELARQRFGDHLLRPLAAVKEELEEEEVQPVNKRSRQPPSRAQPAPTQPRQKERRKPVKPVTPRAEAKSPADEGEADEESGAEPEEKQQKHVDRAREEEEEEVLHDGYQFRPDEFEEYMGLERQLAGTKDTHARIQLMTALRLHRQRIKENWKRPKVDFATNTTELIDMDTEPDLEIERGRTSEKATSITHNRGVDPIAELISEYQQNAQASVLPPDIYMSLRFTGEEGKQQQAGRAFLNVVDLDASAIMKDIKERPETEEPQLDTTISPQQQHITRRFNAEHEPSVPLVTPAGQRTRADELTVKMFETKVQGENRLSMMVVPRDTMPDSKSAVMQRLQEMNHQLSAIDQMSNNIEREFKNTRLAIHTLEEMTNAMAPEAEEEAGEPAPPQATARSTKSARTARSRKSGGSPVRSMELLSAKTPRDKKDTQQSSVEVSKMSGLSGISDIISDLVAKGQIDPNDKALHAALLTDRMEEDVHEVSLEEVKKKALTEERAQQDREELQAWMVAKRQQQMSEYRQHLEMLRERETKPFQSKLQTTDQGMTGKERQTREKSRQQDTRAFMSRRLDEAQHLLGNILTDKPDLPKELPPRKVSPQRKQDKEKITTGKRDRSPVISKPTKYSFPKVTVGRDSFRDHRLDKDEFDIDMRSQPAYDDVYMEDRAYREEPPAPSVRQIHVEPATDVRKPSIITKKQPESVVPKLKLSFDLDDQPRMSQDTSGLRRTVDTTGDLSDYYHAVEAMAGMDTEEPSRESIQQPAPSKIPKKVAKPKPFSELVRLQRPHVTRKQPPQVADWQEIEGMLGESQMETDRAESTRAGTARTQMTDREREKIYGSKRLPTKRPTETGPRRVKTYAERLQEMKPKQTYSTPVAPRSVKGSSVASMSYRPDTRRSNVKPRHKPMTYVEQLQKLNEKYHKPRMGQTAVIQKPMIKSHKPAHKPKTYAQQLQELQPMKTHTVAPSKPSHMTRTVRPRPYKDPYTVGDDAESVVSAWSMSDDVRHLLYDDTPGSVDMRQSASYAPSEQVSDYYDVVMGDSYTASVDIDDLVRIADDGSVSGGSIADFIDWDQVDDLIADVR